MIIRTKSAKPPDAETPRSRAEAAAAAGNWTVAQTLWRRFSQTMPESPEGYTGAARSLRLLGKLDEASSLLEEALCRFPDAEGPLLEQAWVAQASGDPTLTERCWQDIRTRFPEQPDGYTGTAVGLRMQGRFDEAANVLKEARRRFPDAAGPIVEQAWLAQAQGAAGETAKRWREVRRRFPELPEGHTGLVVALRLKRQFTQAAAVLRQAHGRFPDSIELIREEAWLAESRRDWPAAVESWVAVRAREPGEKAGYLQGAAALSNVGRTGEARRLLADAASRFPDDPAIARERGWLAIEQHEWADAAAQFASIRERFPRDASGYLGGAETLRNQNARDAAEATLRDGAKRLPDNPEILLAYAMLPIKDLPHHDCDWDKAAWRIENLLVACPDFERGYAEGIGILRAAGRLADAETLANRACQRFPDDVAIAAHQAEIACEKSGGAAAIQRFRGTKRQVPHDPAEFSLLAEALFRSGDFEAAEALLVQARKRFPADPRLAESYASVAVQRGDWQAASRRWRAARHRFPHDPTLRTRLFHAQLRAADAGIALTGTSTDVGCDNLMAHFESLGGTLHGCEFGFVQRALGAEPLGLLRWAAITPAKLTSALDANFTDVGSSRTTILCKPRSPAGEYFTLDSRFGMEMHTFRRPNEIAAHQMFEQACRRLRFLRDRLIRQLTDGSRIFVYRVTREPLSDTELSRLHQAVRRYGPGTLLYVRRADRPMQAGTVEQWAPGLLVGWIERFSRSSSGQNLGPATPFWTKLCQRAYELTPQGAA